jgi:hypothetical protein
MFSFLKHLLVSSFSFKTFSHLAIYLRYFSLLLHFDNKISCLDFELKCLFALFTFCFLFYKLFPIQYFFLQVIKILLVLNLFLQQYKTYVHIPQSFTSTRCMEKSETWSLINYIFTWDISYFNAIHLYSEGHTLLK